MYWWSRGHPRSGTTNLLDNIAQNKNIIQFDFIDLLFPSLTLFYIFELVDILSMGRLKLFINDIFVNPHDTNNHKLDLSNGFEEDMFFMYLNKGIFATLVPYNNEEIIKQSNIYGNNYSSEDFQFLYSTFNHILYRKMNKKDDTSETKYLLIKPLSMTHHLNEFKEICPVIVQFILCHRNPTESIPSWFDLLSVMNNNMTNSSLNILYEQYSIPIYKYLFDNGIGIKTENVYNLKFTEWKKDPKKKLNDIFNQLIIENQNEYTYTNYIPKKSTHKNTSKSYCIIPESIIRKQISFAS